MNIQQKFQDLEPDVQNRIKQAATTIKAKWLALQKERQDAGLTTSQSETELKDARTPQINPEIVKSIDERIRTVKNLYDSLKASRYENALALENQYRPLAKILSTTIEKSNTLEDVKTPTSVKRSGSKMVFSPTIVKKPRFPLQFKSSSKKQQQPNIPKEEDDPIEDENIEVEAADVTQPSINDSVNQSIFNYEQPDDDDLNQTMYQRDPEKSFFLEEEFQQDPPLPPIRMEEISNASFEEFMDQFDEELARDYVSGYIHDTKNEYDHTYLRYNLRTEKIFFGDSELEFSGSDIIIKGERFKGTPGLYEFLFKTVPIKNKLTSLDERAFAKIVVLTNANKRNFNPKEPSVGNKGLKYTLTIKPILEKLRQESKEKQRERDKQLRIVRTQHPKGYGFKNNSKENCATYKEFSNNKIDYVYWDDPNELVSRLKLLIASAEVGNNSHNNEIASIIEELREAGIIE